jgi:hypothetical protein
MIARPLCKSDAYKNQHPLMLEPMMNVTLLLVGRVKMEAVEPVGHAVDSLHLPRLSQVTVVYAKCYTPVYR